jgi:hypothetical protein
MGVGEDFAAFDYGVESDDRGYDPLCGGARDRSRKAVTRSGTVHESPSRIRGRVRPASNNFGNLVAGSPNIRNGLS